MLQLLLGPILSYRSLLLVAELLEPDRIGDIDLRSILRSLGKLRPVTLAVDATEEDRVDLQLEPGTEERLGVVKLIQFHLVLYPFPMNT